MNRQTNFNQHYLFCPCGNQSHVSSIQWSFFFSSISTEYSTLSINCYKNLSRQKKHVDILAPCHRAGLKTQAIPEPIHLGLQLWLHRDTSHNDNNSQPDTLVLYITEVSYCSTLCIHLHNDHVMSLIILADRLHPQSPSML